MSQRKLPEAIIEYRNAERYAPRQGDIRTKLADAYLKAGDGPNAFRERIVAADLLPNDLNAQLGAAAMNLAAGRFDDARARADKALALDPSSVEARIARGNALAGLKNLGAALSEIQQAITLDPERALTYTDLAGLQFAQGNSQKAEETFKQAITISPKSIQARLALANFYWATGRRDSAETTIREALALDSKNLQANQAMAYLDAATGRAADAEPFLKLVIDNSKDAGAAVLLAQDYALTGRTPQAIAVLDRLAADPSSATLALTRKASILYGTGQKQAAYAVIQSVLAKSPRNSLALLTKALFVGADHDLDQAIKLAQAASASDPASVGARFVTGRLQSDRGDFDEAIASNNEALKIAPHFVPARLERARLSLLQGRPADTLQDADAVLATQPRNVPATLLKARALLAERRPDAAEAPLTMLLAAYPNAPEIQVQLGALYLEKNDRTAARAAYERALKAQPANVEALSALLTLDIAEKAGARARARIDAVLAASPNRDSAPLLVVAARTYGVAGDLAGAERALRRATELDPNNIEALVLLGQVFESEHRLDEAIAEFKDIAKRKPKAAGPPSQIGVFLELQNNRAGAAKWYQQALGIDAKAPVAANNLAMFYADTGGNLDVALKLAQTAKAQLPDEPAVSDTLGWVYIKRNVGALALPFLQQAVSAEPSNPGYLAHLGMAYGQAGQKDRARDALKRALALSSNFPDAQAARNALAALGGAFD